MSIKKYLNLLKFENYKDNKDRIDYENQTGITLILIFYSIILFLNIISTLVSGDSVIQNRNLLLELILMVITVPLYFFYLRKKKINFTLLIYLIEIPMLLITIWHGTFEDPDELTFTFLLFLLILPELILDKPWHVIVFVAAITAVYITADFYAKPSDLFVRDLLHSVNACLMSIAACLYVLSVRIQNNMYINIVEDKADRDPLTGLYNRYGSERYFKKNEAGLLIYMDLDRFKEVNDAYGHGAGDVVLVETADALKSCFRKNDILIRMGGDEFAVFAPGKWSEDAIEKKLNEVSKKVDSVYIPKSPDEQAIDMTVSIGCVYAPTGAETIDELIRAADQKMYDVKRNGKDNYEFVTFKLDSMQHA